MLKTLDAYLKKIYIYIFIDENNHKIRSHLVTIVPVAPFTPISTSIITESEVTDIILSLKNSSAGYDKKSAHILKQNIILYIKPLTHLVNRSIKKGFFSR